MNKIITLASENGSFQMNAFISKKTDKHTMPSFAIMRDDPGKSRYWDNDDFLMKELLPFLLHMPPMSKLWDDISKEEIPEVLEIFQEAIKLDFFNEYNLRITK